MPLPAVLFKNPPWANQRGSTTHWPDRVYFVWARANLPTVQIDWSVRRPTGSDGSSHRSVVTVRV